MIITWTCSFCMWANDNNNGPCHRCGGHTEMRLVNGRWKEVTLKAPNRSAAAIDAALPPTSTRAEPASNPGRVMSQRQLAEANGYKCEKAVCTFSDCRCPPNGDKERP